MSHVSHEVEKSLKISYLFSQFPVPTQTFASSDIDALLELGHIVTVHTIKPRNTATDADTGSPRLAERITILRPSWRKAKRWPALIWRRRSYLRQLIGLITPHLKGELRTALVSLLCLPRVLEIIDEITRNQSDVVHVFWSRQAALVLPVLEKLGAPTVRSSFVGAYDLVADDFLIDIALRHSNAVFSHAEVNRAYIAQKVPPGLPIHIIHRGIPLPAIPDDISRDESLWVTASALTKEKNVAGVISAFALARSLRPELRLVVCGDGPDRDRLEQLCRNCGCSDAITFNGHVQRSELFAIMHQAGVFVMLSKKASERLPNVVKEALWSGCFVITSNSAGITELIPNPSIGQVVDPDDESAVRTAVERALNEDARSADERRRRAKALIATNFSSVANMRNYVAAWKQAMGNQFRPG
ncbi:MAG: glycosyltransferase family 4 protein [Azonexus sp.]|nr:glycosyltransferase family 4 protein [Azonexus sp.]